MMRKKKLGDGGFSIVEAMVAIVILSIIFIPITNSFISSIKASQETKIMQEATSTAQTTMEDFKNRKLIDLFSDSANYTITEGDTSTDAWTKVKLQKVIPKADNDCCDLIVDIAVSKNSSPDELSTSGLSDINNYEVPKISMLDAPSSKVINVGEIPYWIVKKILLSEHTEAELEGKSETELDALRDTVKKNIRRNIDITLDRDISTNHTSIKCVVGYKYKGSFFGSNDMEREKNKTLIEDVVLSEQLKNLFLYYDTSYVGQCDELSFHNEKALTGNFFVIASGGFSGTVLEQVDGLNLDLFKVTSTVAITGGAINYSATAFDTAFLTDREKKTRRYEVIVTVSKKISDTESKVYSSMVSTRGE